MQTEIYEVLWSERSPRRVVVLMVSCLELCSVCGSTLKAIQNILQFLMSKTPKYSYAQCVFNYLKTLTILSKIDAKKIVNQQNSQRAHGVPCSPPMVLETGVVGSSLTKTHRCHARVLLAMFDVSLSVAGNDDANSSTSTHSELTCASRRQNAICSPRRSGTWYDQ